MKTDGLRLCTVLAVLFFMPFLACTPADKKNDHLVQTETQQPVQLTKPDSVLIIGQYCGMCTENCKKMYRCDFRKNQPAIIRVDNGNSFFKKNTITFSDEIADTVLYRHMVKLADQLDQYKLYFPDSVHRLGCPDCRDECGNFIQLIKGNKNLTLYMERNTANLPPYIRLFAADVENTLTGLHK